MKASIIKKSNFISALLRFTNTADGHTLRSHMNNSWLTINEKDSSLLVNYKSEKRNQRPSINFFAGPHGAFISSAK